MTYKEKKSLYESIMKEVAKTVKRNINETDVTHIATKKPSNKLYDQIYDQIKKIPLEYYYNSDNNEKFYSKFPNDIILKGDKIGFEIKVDDLDNSTTKKYVLLRDSLGKAIEDFNILLFYSISNDISIYISRINNIFFKAFNFNLSKEQQEKIDSNEEKFYYSVVKNKFNDFDEIIKSLEKMNFESIF